MDTQIASTRRSYPSDLNDAQWALIEPLLPPPQSAGRPRTTSIREVVNAILYLAKNGCGWRALPHDFPPEGTVRGYFHDWSRRGVWQSVHDALRRETRIQAGRDPEPSAAIIDSQSVKATRTAGTRGYDAGKKINGTKRHLMVDTLGLLIVAVVHSAAIQDRDGAKRVLSQAADAPRIKLVWADGGYAGQLVEWTRQTCGWKLEIVKRSDDVSGFVVLPRRWVVERTIGWLSGYRRLSKDYEYHTRTTESFIHLAMTHLMLQRLTSTQESRHQLAA